MNKDKNVHDSVANMKYIEVLRTHKYSVEIPESKKSQMGKAARSTCTIDRVAEVTGSVKSPPGGDTSAKKKSSYCERYARICHAPSTTLK